MGKIRFQHAIIFTSDIAAAKGFYNGLLGLDIVQDFDTFVLLEGNLALHRADVFYGYLEKPYSGEAMGRDNLDLYFTTGELKEAEERLKSAGVRFIHGIRKFPWGEPLCAFMIPTGTSWR